MVAWLTRKADALEKARLDVDNESVEKARVGSIKAPVDVPAGNVKEELWGYLVYVNGRLSVGLFVCMFVLLSCWYIVKIYLWVHVYVIWFIVNIEEWKRRGD